MASDPPPWPLLQIFLAARSRDFAYAPNTEGQAPDPVDIPYSWINPPLIRRPTTAQTKAQVSQTGGATARSSASAATVRQYGVNTFTANLDTAVDADPQNLAAFVTTYQSTPRPRQPTIVFNLLKRTDEECLLLLGVRLATRVRITDAPATWPPGAVTFVVEGIRHLAGVETRAVEWMTSAPIGSVAGVPGPWFRWDSSSWDGTDLRPF